MRDAGQLWAALRERPAILVIIEASPHIGADAPALVRAVRARFPGVTVAAFCHARSGLSGEVLDLARAGVHDLLVKGIDDQVNPAHLLAHAARRGTADDILAHWTRLHAPKRARDIVRYFLEAAGHPIRVAALAPSLGTSPRALRKYLQRADLPNAQALAAWCRLLVVARLLDDPTNTVERVAHDLEFSSANALRNMLKRYAGISPTALRDRGGYAYLRDVFVAQVSGSRALGAARDG
ncbi:MAG TPA: AraC family transcriptional regulator [Gemmatirosa sp.]